MLNFSIITPVLNSSELLLQTLESVALQIGTGSFLKITHIIVDGDSSDSTLSDAKKFIAKNSNPAISYILLSQPDESMYEAIVTGLQYVTPGIVSYQNAGDLYHQGAFAAIYKACTHPTNRTQAWFYGRKASFTHDGTCVIDSVPMPYRKELALAGYYGYRNRSLGFFQQESLFFSHELLVGFDKEKFSKYKLAGDFYLFLHLIKQQPGTFIDALLSGHRIHSGQLSENLDSYKIEMSSLIQPRNLTTFFRFLADKIAGKFPQPVKRFFHTDIFEWNSNEKLWNFKK